MQPFSRFENCANSLPANSYLVPFFADRVPASLIPPLAEPSHQLPESVAHTCKRILLRKLSPRPQVTMEITEGVPVNLEDRNPPVYNSKVHSGPHISLGCINCFFDAPWPACCGIDTNFSCAKPGHLMKSSTLICPPTPQNSLFRRRGEA